MFERTSLEGRRVAVLAADGFEKIELTLPLKALQAKGAEVDIISARAASVVSTCMNRQAASRSRARSTMPIRQIMTRC